MANFNMNKVILGGRISTDITYKTLENGCAMVRFSIAVNREFSKTDVDYIPIVAYDNKADFVNNFFDKGMSISVVGSFNINQKEKDGNMVYYTSVKAEEIYFVDSKSEMKRQYEKNYFDNSDSRSINSSQDDLPF